MPTLTMLIGLPGCGKSTWRELAPHDAYVASSDDFIEAFAKQSGKTYNEVFAETIDDASAHVHRMVALAIGDRRDLIVDRTNLTAKSRKAILAQVPRDWKVRAIVFKFRDHAEWTRRLNARVGKAIPNHVLADMMSRYEEPSYLEGFLSVHTYYS